MRFAGEAYRSFGVAPERRRATGSAARVFCNRSLARPKPSVLYPEQAKAARAGRSEQLTRTVVGIHETLGSSESTVDRVTTRVCSDGVADLERVDMARGDDGPALGGGGGSPTQRDGMDTDLTGVGCEGVRTISSPLLL